MELHGRQLLIAPPSLNRTEELKLLRAGYISQQAKMVKHDKNKAKTNRWWCPDCNVSHDRSHTYCGGGNGTKADLANKHGRLKQEAAKAEKAKADAVKAEADKVKAAKADAAKQPAQAPAKKDAPWNKSPASDPSVAAPPAATEDTRRNESCSRSR